MQRQDTTTENPWKSYFQVISKYCGEIVQHLKLVSDLVQSVVRKDTEDDDRFSETLIEITRDIVAAVAKIQQSLPEDGTAGNSQRESEARNKLKKIVGDIKINVVVTLRLSGQIISSEQHHDEKSVDEFNTNAKQILVNIKQLVSTAQTLVPKIQRKVSVQNLVQRPKSAHASTPTKNQFLDVKPAEGRLARLSVSHETVSYARSMRIELATGEELPPVIKRNDIFVVEDETEEKQIPVLMDLRDIYSLSFLPNPHYVYLGYENDKCTSVVAVNKVAIIEPSPVINLGTSHQALVIDKQGQTPFTISSFALQNVNSTNVEASIGDFLNQRSKLQNGSFVSDNNDTEFRTDLLELESKHSRMIDAMKVAVLYVRPGQTVLSEVFQNQPDSHHSFWKMMDKLADAIVVDGWKNYCGDFSPDCKARAYYTVWRDEIEIMFHLAPWMEKEQHRRLIGNDIGFIVYYDDPTCMTSFNPAFLEGLGTVPQLFSVIQPWNNLFRFGSFTRPSIKKFLPQNPPADYMFDIYDLKEYLFTYLHNGMNMAMSCPPMNRFFSIPRAHALEELGRKFQKALSEKKSVKKKGLPTLNLMPPKDQKKAGFSLSKGKGSEYSTLVVMVLSGKNLVKKDKTTLSDPFVTVKVGSVSEKSLVARHTVDPTWNCALLFKMPSIGEKDKSEIEIIVRHYDRFCSDSYMGQLNLPIQDIMQADNQRPFWKALSNHLKDDTVVSGELQIQFEFM